MLRNKIILVQGKHLIAKRITSSELSQINIDRIILITALRYPEYLPPKLDPMNPNKLLEEIEDVFLEFQYLERGFLVSAEYAEALVQRREEIQIVEGMTMNLPWIYDMIRTLHKNLGQSIIDVLTGEEHIRINNVVYPWEEGLNWLKIQPSFG